MTYAAKRNGMWTELPPYEDVVFNYVAISWEALMKRSVPEQEALNAFLVVEADPVPEGKIVVAREIVGDDRPAWEERYEDAPPTPPAVAPDNPTLGDWRVGLFLWKTESGNRRDDLLEKVKALVASGHPLGGVADERVNYSNNVLRGELMLFAPAVGFSDDDIEESLWRAEQVRKGDLSGVWPLPAEPTPAT